jgi:hypothetical protein
VPNDEIVVVSTPLHTLQGETGEYEKGWIAHYAVAERIMKMEQIGWTHYDTATHANPVNGAIVIYLFLRRNMRKE